MSVVINNLQIDERLNRLQAFNKSDDFDWQLAAYSKITEGILKDADSVPNANINRHAFLQTSLLATMLLAQQQLNGVPAESSENVYYKCSMQILQSGKIKLGEISGINQLPRVDAKPIDVVEESKTKAVDNDEIIFNGLAKKWREETKSQSSISRIVMHPSYLRIIGMGKEIIPYILKDLQKSPSPSYWFVALNALVEEPLVKPEIKPEYAGNMRKIADVWIEWGFNNGFLK